jgi:hypothetical protein
MQKDVENEGRTGYVYENKLRETKCTPLNPDFCRGMRRMGDNRQESVGLRDRKCGISAIVRGGGGLRIGSSDHRPIDPLEQHDFGFRWLDDPMARSLHLFMMYQKQKGLVVYSEMSERFISFKQR